MNKEISVSKIFILLAITFILSLLLTVSQAIPLSLSVNAKKAYIMEKPSTNSDRLTTVQSSSKKYSVSKYIRGTDGEMWYKTKINGVTGYIRGNNVKIYARRVIITGDDVNVRAGVGTSNDVITTVSEGQKYIVLATAKDSSGVKWYKIRVGNNIGYVISTYAVIKNTYDVSGVTKNRIAVTGDSVNIRSSAKVVAGNEVGVAYLGDIFYLEGKVNDSWYKITYKNKTAYISVSYAQNIGQSFISIDLSAQKLYFYIDNIKILEAPVVTGTNECTPTPKGIFSIAEIDDDGTTLGENDMYVQYWLNFYDKNNPDNVPPNIYGIHDAWWRYGNFGGNIYETNGSHGCVNVSLDTARELSILARDNDHVIIHR